VQTPQRALNDAEDGVMLYRGALTTEQEHLAKMNSYSANPNPSILVVAKCTKQQPGRISLERKALKPSLPQVAEAQAHLQEDPAIAHAP